MFRAYLLAGEERRAKTGEAQTRDTIIMQRTSWNLKRLNGFSHVYI